MAAVAVAQSTTALAQSPAAPASAPAGQPQIVWLEQGAGNPYWDAQHAAAAAAGTHLGFDFKAVSGNSNPSSQAATLMQLADQGVSAIMLNAIDPTATAPSVAYAIGKGVPVINLYGVDPASTASITFDEVHVGEVAAQNALDLLTKRNGTPTGKIAVLTGSRGSRPATSAPRASRTSWPSNRACRSWMCSPPAGRPTRRHR